MKEGQRMDAAALEKPPEEVALEQAISALCKKISAHNERRPPQSREERLVAMRRYAAALARQEKKLRGEA